MKRYAGLKKVSYSDTENGSYTQVTGKISAESSLELPNTTTESTDGLVFGGGQIQAEIMFLDYADHATIESMMTSNDVEKFWKLEFKDGTVFTTKEAINPMTELGTGVNARDGAVAWKMTLEKYAHYTLVTVS